jgi:soluble lytic murein transglycosylase-like protein
MVEMAEGKPMKWIVLTAAFVFAFGFSAEARPSRQPVVACVETGTVMIPVCDGSAFSKFFRSVSSPEIKRAAAARKIVRAPVDAAVKFIGGLRAMVDAAASSAGVPGGIAHAVIRQESNYNPHLRGSAGEWGLGQIKCQTAREVGLAGNCGQLADAAVNLRFSMAYLRRALDRGGNGCAGVSLYQRGIYGRASCSGYGRAVMARVTR